MIGSRWGIDRKKVSEAFLTPVAGVNVGRTFSSVLSEFLMVAAEGTDEGVRPAPAAQSSAASRFDSPKTCQEGMARSLV